MFFSDLEAGILPLAKVNAITSNLFFIPPLYPVKLSFVPTTLWHGIIIQIGFQPTAPPTAFYDIFYMS